MAEASTFSQRIEVDFRCRQYEFIVNTSREFMTLIAKDHTYEAVNEAYCQAHNKAREDILGKTVADVWGKEVYSAVLKPNLDQCFAGHEVHVQAWFTFPALGLRCFDIVYYPYRNVDGTVTHVVVVSRDITRHKQAEEKLRQHAERLSVLSEIDQAILSTRSPQAIAQAALSHIGRLIPCQQASVAEIDLEKREVVMLAGYRGDRDGGGTTDSRENSERTVDGWTLMWDRSFDELWRNRADLVPDLRVLPSPSSTQQALCHQGVRSTLTVPLMVQEKPVGILTLGADRVNAFVTEHVDVASEVANRLAVAIQGARLYEAREQARRTTEILQTVNLSLTQSLDLDARLQSLLKHLGRLIPYDSANVMLLDRNDRLSVCASQGYERWIEPELVHSLTFDLESNPVFQMLLSSRRSILIPDVAGFPGWRHHPATQHVRNWLGVPLVASGTAIGLYALDKAEPDFFNARHRQLAEAVAAQAAIAIQNAQLFKQVRVGNERLQALSQRLVEIQENERRYIARELHDEVGQALTALMVRLRLLERQVERSQTVLDSLAELRQVASGVLENLHRLAVDLHPVSLDHLGLVTALDQYLETFKRQYSLDIRFDAESLKGKRLLPEMKTALYRIVQEALTNVVRHAQATQVDILLDQRDGHLVALIEDDGVGFDQDQALPGDRLGLFGMQERAAMLGGTLMVESATGVGTTIRVEIPYGDPDPYCR